MNMLKKIFSQWHTFVLWALASAIFWSWIFTFVTETSPDKKVTVYCKAPEIQDTALAAALEEEMPEGLRMIKVHSFEYVMFGVEAFYQGDIFIVPESEIATYAEILAPVDGEQGVKVYDAASGTGIATAYISYANEDYYLFLGKDSPHLEDGKALSVARRLLTMESCGGQSLPQ